MKFTTIVVDTRQRDTILAALRLYESMLVTGEQIPHEILCIAADTGSAIDTKEINELCERINRSDAK